MRHWMPRTPLKPDSTVVVVLVGLLWPEDEDPIGADSLAKVGKAPEVQVPAEEAKEAPTPEAKAAAPLAPLPDGPIAERVRIELDPSQVGEDEQLDERQLPLP